jgi:hypothetical protein
MSVGIFTQSKVNKSFFFLSFFLSFVFIIHKILVTISFLKRSQKGSQQKDDVINNFKKKIKKKSFVVVFADDRLFCFEIYRMIRLVEQDCRLSICV